jgi:PAS domain S-box-containing protein
MWQTVLRGDVFQSEIANRKKSGELFHEVKTITPLRDTQGNITHFVATGKDITERKLAEENLLKAYDELEMRVWARTEELRLANTELEKEINERKQAEQAVRQNEAMLRAILEQMPSGVTVRDASTGKLILSNVRSLEIMYALADIPEQFAEYRGFHPDGRAYRSEEWPAYRSMTTGELVNAEEIECERMDGTRFTISVSAAPIYNVEGKIVSGVAVFDDITERKRAEKALQAANEELTRFNRAMVGRELRLIEMKKEVNDLCTSAGLPPRYSLDFANGYHQER